MKVHTMGVSVCFFSIFILSALKAKALCIQWIFPQRKLEVSKAIRIDDGVTVPPGICGTPSPAGPSSKPVVRF